MEKQGEITRRDVTRRHTAIRTANDGRIIIENLFTLILRIFSFINYYEIRIIAGMGQAPHLGNWVIGKGVQMKVIWKSADQTEKQRMRLHVACILLVGVLGQNVTGKMPRTQCRRQNIMRTKCYWSKCQDILSMTFFRQHIFIGQNGKTFCPMTFC